MQGEDCQLDLDVIAAGNKKAELELLPAKFKEERKKSAELPTKSDVVLKDISIVQEAGKASKSTHKIMALKVVQKFMKSAFYCEDMKTRYNGGQIAAHHYFVHGCKLTQDDQDKDEIAYEKGEHTKMTWYETQTFTDMVI